MSERIVAVLNTIEDAREAIVRLRREGIPRDAITTMSSEPFHTEPGASDESKSRIPLFAICGGLLGAVFAIALTVTTSRRVDLVTGGMPIVTPWAFGIIVFELTALGAILATFGRMFYESRLALGISPPDFDDAVANGKILLCVDGRLDSDGDKIRRVLTAWMPSQAPQAEPPSDSRVK